MRYITDTVQVTLAVGSTTLVISTFVSRIANGWRPSRWLVEGYESEEDYNLDCYEAANGDYAQQLLEESWAKWDDCKGECAGCRWITNEDLLPCAVNPVGYGQGCFDYEAV